MAVNNRSWNLESFVDALVIELDKTRETLALKAMNRPLSYSVKDMALDLQIFPTYDGEEVKFVTAQPGEEGASKISLQLSSITDQQVRATSKKPSSKEDIKIDQIEVDEDTKKSLRKIGVTSVQDLEDMEKRNVDIEKVTPGKINYTKLVNLIQKSKRDKNPPKVKAVSMSQDETGKPIIVVKGENLAIRNDFSPVAVIDEQLAEVLFSNEHEIRLVAPQSFLQNSLGELIITADPFSVFKIQIK
ncbi:MAG: hypothetical protein IT270_05885 [Saprospiraceae bacterium]|nr:hypothetical protein [Saprospiraceae bacterium]